MKIVIQSIGLDAIDAAVLKQHGAKAASAVAVEFQGRLDALEFGQAIGATIKAWLENVRTTQGGPERALTDEERERILEGVFMAMSLALHTSIRTVGGKAQ